MKNPDLLRKGSDPGPGASESRSLQRYRSKAHPSRCAFFIEACGVPQRMALLSLGIRFLSIMNVYAQSGWSLIVVW
jgi:hypothetical protein